MERVLTLDSGLKSVFIVGNLEQATKAVFCMDDMTLPKTTPRVSTHEDFGVLVDFKNLFNSPIGAYRVAKPLDIRTYKNRDGYSATFTAFPRIVGVGGTLREAQGNAIRHLLHSRNFYAELPEGRGTLGAKRQSMLMKQYLQ